MNDAVNGQVPVAIATVFVTNPHVQSGKVRALGVTSAKPTPQMPGVKTVADQGVPNYSAVAWWGSSRRERHLRRSSTVSTRKSTRSSGPGGRSATQSAGNGPHRRQARGIRQVPEERDRTLGKGRARQQDRARRLTSGVPLPADRADAGGPQQFGDHRLQSKRS